MRFREPPSSWYDPPDEPSDAEEEACRDAWLEYLDADYCEDCSWTASDDDKVSNAAPCADCAQGDSTPQAYSDWCADWHDEQRRKAYD